MVKRYRVSRRFKMRINRLFGGNLCGCGRVVGKRRVGVGVEVEGNRECGRLDGRSGER